MLYLMARSRYGFYQVSGNKGSVWWFWYYDAGGIQRKKSTKQKVRGKNPTPEAVEAVEKFLSLEIRPVKAITLNEFAKDFFIWDKCEWIKRQHLQAHPFSKAVASDRRGHIEHYIFPVFGALGLRSIRAAAVSDYEEPSFESNPESHSVFVSNRYGGGGFPGTD
jgi:hypothetical protein